MRIIKISKTNSIYFSFGIIFGILLCFTYFWFFGENVLLSISDCDKSMTAKIVWYHQLPFDFVKARLKIEKFTGQTLLDVPLVEDRDDLGDLQTEFKGLKFSGSTLELNCTNQHYQGPNVFHF
jgi:hypothetical protein